MSTRQSRSASIPIPPSSVTRSLENVIPMSFSPPPAPRARVPSAGTSASFNLNRGIHLPPRSTSSSYASAAITAAPRGRTSGPSQASSPPVFEPRIIRATPSPNPSRDPACNPPYSPSTSPARPRRQSSGVRTQIALGTSPVAHRAHPPAHPGHHTPHGFPRPAYLDNSALRDMLHTEPASSVLATTSRHLTYPASGHDVRPGTSPAPAIPYPYLRRELTPSGDSDDESVAANTTSPPAVGAVTMLSTNNVLMLPTRWSEQDRTPSLSVSLDGRELTFTGPSCMGERESSAARTNHSIPPACGIYYYEVEVLHKCPKGPISIGFSAPDVRLSRLPGWEKNTWGYHADDGWAFPGHKDGTAYGPTFDTGDVIGCGIDFSLNRVFYTKNGGFLGLVFENVGKTTEIYPCIGMRQTHESIRANFGSSPFRFAIEDHVRTQRDTVWGNIMKTRIDWSLLGLGPFQTEEERKVVDMDSKAADYDSSADEDARAPLRKLVLAYLAHHGYARTARAFQKQCADCSIAALDKIRAHSKADLLDDEVKMAIDDVPAVASAPGPPGDSEFGFDQELNTRLSITNAIARGDIDAALSLIQLHHCTVLEREGGLVRFRLRCRKFVELVLEAGQALRRVKEVEGTRSATPKVIALPTLDGEDVVGTLDGVGAMDVDNPSLEAQFASSPSALITPSSSVLAITSPVAISTPSSVATPAHTTLSAAARMSLHTALSYGQTLEADYKNDTRSSVRVHLRRTFGVVAYDDPVAAGGEVAEIAGQTARNALAAEVNQAILESQGRPAHPALETLFRQAGACMTQLGLLNVGSVAFADVRREFVEG